MSTSVVSNLEKDSEKRDRRQIESILTQGGAKNVHRKQLCCPFHDDKHPSASINQAPSGFWYFHCFVCNIHEDVWALRSRVTGIPVGEVLKEALPSSQPQQTRTARPPKPKVENFATIDELIESYRIRNPHSRIEEVNAYTDPSTGHADFYTLRIKPPDKEKTFRQVSKSDHGWQWTGPSGKVPLFNRGRIEKCERVLIVEGEKCVREVTKIGLANIAATTSPGGAMNAAKADWTPLIGKKCYIWRDNDEPGKKYEADVIAELMKLDTQVYRVRVEDLGLDPKQDVADYISEESMTNAEKVAAVELCLFDAEPLNITSALEDKFTRIIAGEFRAIPFPQKPQLSDGSKAIMPGCLTTIVGEPGAGKSFFVLEDFWRWILVGESVKLMMLEDDSAFHQNRVLAQMSGCSDLLDPEFVAENPQTAADTLNAYRDRLETVSRHIEIVNEQITLTEIGKWVITHAKNGVRIIIVDPVTAAKSTDKPWIEDQKFLFEVKPVLESTGASLILTTHPRIGQAGKPSLSGIAGGASYPRFSQCVLWLRNLDQSQESRAWDGYLTRTVTHKQTIQIRKARNGKGQGKHIAVNLNHQNLCFDELGVIESSVSE
jgi:hypothetical protein